MHILIVDDNANLRKALTDVLKKRGYTPVTAETGQEALAKIQIEPPAVALLDLKLGDMSGLDVMRELKEHSPDTECIVLTGHASQKSAIETVNLGAYSYMQKPYDMEMLLVTVHRAVEKRAAEQALRENEQRYQAIVEDQTELICRFRPDEILTFVNAAYCRYVGKPRRNLIGQRVMPSVLRDGQEGKQSPPRSLSPESPVVTYEHRMMAGDGKARWQQWSTRAIFDEHNYLLEYQAVGHDITPRKQAEQELVASRTQLRNLSAHLQAIREEERTTIAREIHDELGQTLTALKLDLAWLKKHGTTDIAVLLNKIAVMEDLIDSTLQSVKRISTELRPGLLDDLGLSAAIEWQAEEFQRRTGIRCDVLMIPEEIIVENNLSTAVFRIFQETLTNVARHAGATALQVLLRQEAGELLLEVRDNGIGITEAQIASSSSFGLIGIRERVQFLGGEICFQGGPGQGTTVTVTVPL